MAHNCLLNLLNNTAVLCEVPYVSSRSAPTSLQGRINTSAGLGLKNFKLAYHQLSSNGWAPYQTISGSLNAYFRASSGPSKLFCTVLH